jgi:hypothetical protein
LKYHRHLVDKLENILASLKNPLQKGLKGEKQMRIEKMAKTYALT